MHCRISIIRGQCRFSRVSSFKMKREVRLRVEGKRGSISPHFRSETMSDNLVKPSELTVPVVEVGQNAVRQTNQLVQRKMAPPLNLSPPLKKSIAKPNFATKSDVEIELAEM